MTMPLSRVDRWVLSNQYRILEKLDPDEADYHREAREALDSGYELHYEWLAQHIYDGPHIMTEAECREVIDIMQMFRVLKDALARIADKTGIDDWAVTFAGFDGNSEAKQLGYARFYCQYDGGRFTELERGDNFNSHIPSLGRYRRQTRAWKESRNENSLTEEDVRRIAAAAIHPE
jgi:uncharacterized protein YfbU (UPF0304 family)